MPFSPKTTASLTAVWKYANVAITPAETLARMEEYVVEPQAGAPDIAWIWSRVNDESVLITTNPVVPGSHGCVVQGNVNPRTTASVNTFLSTANFVSLFGVNNGAWQSLPVQDSGLVLILDTSPNSFEASILGVIQFKTGVTSRGFLTHEMYDIRIKHAPVVPKAFSLLVQVMHQLVAITPIGLRYSTALRMFLQSTDPRVTADDVAKHNAASLWIGCMNSSPTDLLTVLFYEALGFYFPGFLPGFDGLTNQTPLGTTYPFRFLSGYFLGEADFKAFLASGTSMFMKVALNKEHVRRIIGDNAARVGAVEQWGLLNEPNEIGGTFVGTATPDAILSAEAGMTRGPPGGHTQGGCTVQIPQTPAQRGTAKFSWHSHPIVCHQSTGLINGFPSTPDYAVAIYNFCSKNEDGHFVFAREGVHVIQLHPVIKHLALTKGVPEPLVQAIGAAFLDFLRALGYEQKRYGVDPRVQALSGKLLSGIPFTSEELDLIYNDDNGAIGTLAANVMSFTFQPGPFAFPLIYLQTIPRSAFSSTGAGVGSLYTPMRAMAS